jgi:DNA-binding CsgD family transcriptional regulator
MRRKKAARKAGPSKPLSAHEAGKPAPHGAKAVPKPSQGFTYDDESIHQPKEPLTVREEEILEFVAHRQTNEEIARREKITEKTVEKHIENLYPKIPVNNRADAVAWYWMRRYAALEKRLQRES